jgi:hypothetical protein
MAGVTLNDKKLAASVRTLTLGKIKKILETEYDKSTQLDDYRFQRDLILKLAPTVLPRITELSGEDGGPIQIQGVDISIRKNNAES